MLQQITMFKTRQTSCGLMEHFNNFALQRMHALFFKERCLVLVVVCPLCLCDECSSMVYVSFLLLSTLTTQIHKKYIAALFCDSFGGHLYLNKAPTAHLSRSFGGCCFFQISYTILHFCFKIIGAYSRRKSALVFNSFGYIGL